jgi:hypothetical protein
MAVVLHLEDLIEIMNCGTDYDKCYMSQSQIAFSLFPHGCSSITGILVADRAPSLVAPMRPSIGETKRFKRVAKRISST